MKSWEFYQKDWDMMAMTSSNDFASTFDTSFNQIHTFA
jgi:hypothetical protein